MRHNTAALKEGYRAVLTYRLTSETPHRRPQLHSNIDSIAAIRPIFQEWLDVNGAPSKLVVSLNHKCTNKSIVKGTDLTDKDALLLALVSEVAESLGLHVSLGILTYMESGIGSDVGHPDHPSHSRKYGCPAMESDAGSTKPYCWIDEDLEMEEVEHRETTLEGLVELDGSKIRDSIPFSRPKECVELYPIPDGYDREDGIECNEYDYDCPSGGDAVCFSMSLIEHVLIPNISALAGFICVSASTRLSTRLPRDVCQIGVVTPW